MSQEFYQKDPRKVSDLASSSIHFYLHEGLTKMTPFSKQASLGIAKSIQKDKAQTTYIFELDDRFYSTGEKITAYDFEKSWKEALTTDFYCPNIHLFFAIKNAKLAKQGLINQEAIGIKALNEKTLEVKLEYPLSCFLEIIAFSTFIPFKNENSFSGPYKIQSLICNNQLVLSGNSFYPFSSNKLPLNIEISFIKDEMTIFNLFEKGMIDLIGTPFTSIPKEVLEYHGKSIEIKTQPNMGVCCITINQKSNFFQNFNLVQSIKQEIDRTSITNHILHLPGKETKYIIPNAMVDDHLSINLKKETTNNLFIELKLIYPASGSYPKLAQFLQQEFLKKWNISLILQGLEPKIYSQRLQNQDFDLALTTIFAQYQDPLSVLERYYEPTDPKNIIRFDSEYFRETINLANNSFDPKIRFDFLKKAEKILLEESGIIPLYQTSTNYIIQQNLKDVLVNSSGGFNFENTYFENPKS